MKKLFVAFSLFLFAFTAQAQKTMISASVEKNIIVDPRSNLGHLKRDPTVNQTRIVINYGKSVIPNGFITLGLGFEIFGVGILNDRTAHLYAFNARRLLLPVAFRYAVPMNDKLNISGQLGAQMGLFVNGDGTYFDMEDHSNIERKKDVYNTFTGDINLAIGIDRKLNANNMISIATNTNIYMTNLLKDGNQLKPISLGVKVGYVHVFK